MLQVDSNVSAYCDTVHSGAPSGRHLEVSKRTVAAAIGAAHRLLSQHLLSHHLRAATMHVSLCSSR